MLLQSGQRNESYHDHDSLNPQANADDREGFHSMLYEDLSDTIHKFSSFFPSFFLQLEDPSTFPAVIVEQMPHSHLLNYSGLTCDQPLRLGLERDPVDDMTQLTGWNTYPTQVSSKMLRVFHTLFDQLWSIVRGNKYEDSFN